MDGARTRDIQNHNLALYQLSYYRHVGKQRNRIESPPKKQTQNVWL